MSQTFEASTIILPQPNNKPKKSQEVKIDIREINSQQHNECNLNRTNHITKWMERMEVQNGGLPGAYDVLRCDLTYDPTSKTKRIKHHIWGLEFHLSRLQHSFQELLPFIIHTRNNKKQNQNYTSSFSANNTTSSKRMMVVGKQALEKALFESKAIIDALIIKMCQIHEKSLKMNKRMNGAIIVKLTLFWAAIIPNDYSTDLSSTDVMNEPYVGISVKGNSSTDGIIIDPRALPQAIIASLALPSLPQHLQESNNNDNDEGMSMVQKTLDNALPDRKSMPQAKISSWSRQRQLLQDKHTFQPNGVYEVLLLDLDKGNKTMNATKNLEILEGVSSNFFAVYHDNTIRTATSKVLFGYARHLVLQFAPKCGLTIDPRPIRLADGLNGLWKETFITSSSRLIYPIKQILIPDYDDSNMSKDKGNLSLRWKEFWTSTSREENGQKPRWELILHEMLIHGGYDVNKFELIK